MEWAIAAPFVGCFVVSLVLFEAGVEAPPAHFMLGVFGLLGSMVVAAFAA